jgi:hypothetical protein
MRWSLGTAVFFGMIGVTLFGIFLTPVFFYVIRRPFAREAPDREPAVVAAGGQSQANGVAAMVFTVSASGEGGT